MLDIFRRLKYQPEEDDAILCYVSKYARMSGCTGSLTGNLIWKKMQSEKVTLRGTVNFGLFLFVYKHHNLYLFEPVNYLFL